MLRAALAVLATLVLVGVLVVLIVESRAVKEDYYVAHAERVRAIETSENDLTAITRGTQSAFQEGRSVAPSVELAATRLLESGRLLLNTNDTTLQRSTPSLERAAYGEALSKYIRDEKSFAAKQNALAEALRSLQDESPWVVKDLRRLELDAQSQNAYSLALDMIEHVTGQNTSDLEALTSRVEALGSDSEIESLAPGRLDEFVEAANSVIVEHAASQSALEKITGSRISDVLFALSGAISDENRRIVSRVERAQLLLSVCAVLLLVGTAYAMLRLQASYRSLNKSNADLEKINNSLEERVNSRTEELSLAYDELKESQVHLVQAEKMSSLGGLVAGISHEINTPLWYLTNNSTVIQERLTTVSKFCEISESMLAAVRSGSSPKEAVRRGLVDIQRMLSNGMRDDIDEAQELMQDSICGLEDLMELAQSLKDFSRLDRARQGQFNVNDGLDKTLLIAKNKLKYSVNVKKDYGAVPLIHCAPSQINQIFLNLITNAADAITDIGEIVIRTWSEDGNVCISIADTGCGIPADVLSKIRDPFFTTKEVGKGTGLGLSIVEQIVGAHGGELRVESEPEQGTVVTVVLPFGEAEQLSVAEDSGQHEAWASDAAKTAAGNKEFEVPEAAPNWAAM
ncbi:MAG: sensor histidine kinase [Woeseiaceae bacterium]